MKNVAVCFIGTNKYFNFFDRYYQSAKINFLPDCNKTFLLFTDKNLESTNDIKVYNIEHKNWPYITLYRFKFILQAQEEIKKNDWFVFVDADMFFNKCIEYKDFFNDSKELFGVQHPGLIDQIGTFEFNLKSLAGVNPVIEDISTYWQGCLWGGKSKKVLEMCNELNTRIDKDLSNDIIAVWHDESHMNKYFIENKNTVHTLDSGFAYPEKWNIPFEKKIVHIHKNNFDLHK